ncbi:hypothetical protein VQ045_04395 [Aurantimonas sp. E1-2-R+4]|uniref:hypothetical protein n=1 Tax=Aurantimonas sp. E1-2-R+4 TaxID=3113714 RepID=UPI002F943E56
MADDDRCSGRGKPANDNRPTDGQEAGHEALDASERLDAAVLSIARLIGRQIAREDHEKAMRAANDNRPPEAGDDDG